LEAKMLYYFIFIGAVILILAIIISVKYGSREKRYIKKLNFHLQRKEYASAAEFAHKLISLNPKKADYHMLLADIHLRSKMVPSAVKIYKRMISDQIFSTKIKEHHIREKLAMINLNEGMVKEAFRELFIIAHSNPNSASATGLLGRIYGSQKQYNQAEKFLKKSVALDPTNAEFHYQLGILYLDAGDLSRGVKYLDDAYKLDSEHVKCQYFLALAFRQKGLQESANNLFEKLNLKDTENLPANVTRIGIMTQKIPAFGIEEMEKQLTDEIGSINMKKKDASDAISIEKLINSGADLFHSASLNIINKMGYIIQKEVKTQLTDSSSEIDFIVIPKKERHSPEAKQYYLQIIKSASEIGAIPYADFLSNMNETKMSNGIFIITSHFSSNILDRIKNEKGEIILIDADKLTKYL
jgi:tetratricopeptide (TPR) repeat protein